MGDLKYLLPILVAVVLVWITYLNYQLRRYNY